MPISRSDASESLAQPKKCTCHTTRIKVCATHGLCISLESTNERTIAGAAIVALGILVAPEVAVVVAIGALLTGMFMSRPKALGA